jgi:hypothetical protein
MSTKRRACPRVAVFFQPDSPQIPIFRCRNAPLKSKFFYALKSRPCVSSINPLPLYANKRVSTQKTRLFLYAHVENSTKNCATLKIIKQKAPQAKRKTIGVRGAIR